MPIENKIWKITNNNVKALKFSPIDTEKRLEDLICKDISIISEDLLIIGRQIRTSFNKVIDLLAINYEGKLTIIELKKQKTYRDVVSQIIDYASWVQDLTYEDIKEICEDHYKTDTFETIFQNKFGDYQPEEFFSSHDMLIVCSELDYNSERIINYLSENYSVPINVVFFQFFKDIDDEFLSRSWLIDPKKIDDNIDKIKKYRNQEQWNGKDFVVNIGFCSDGTSSWEDCYKYGFISAGGGKWYSNSLKNLHVGARVFAMIPKQGYVGVGYVEDTVKSIKDFKIEYNGSKITVDNLPTKCDRFIREKDNEKNCEYFVKINWLNKLDKPFWISGLRANQNSAFKLKNKFTIEKLVEVFNIEKKQNYEL